MPIILTSQEEDEILVLYQKYIVKCPFEDCGKYIYRPITDCGKVKCICKRVFCAHCLIPYKEIAQGSWKKACKHNYFSS